MLVTVLVAVCLGSAIGLRILTAYAKGVTGAASPSIPVHDYAAILATAAALATIATRLPARTALTRR